MSQKGISKHTGLVPDEPEKLAMLISSIEIRYPCFLLIPSTVITKKLTFDLSTLLISTVPVCCVVVMFLISFPVYLSTYCLVAAWREETKSKGEIKMYE